jgi:hypothetical protein
MKLKYGMRKQIEDLADHYRGLLNLGSRDRLDPFCLCDELGVPYLALSKLDISAADRKALTGGSAGDFFACVVPISATRRGIVFNDTAAPTKTASDIAHELAHIILDHELQPPALENGERSYSSKDEHEARELGMALLVPKFGCKSCADEGLTDKSSAVQYGISPSLMAYRMRITNARAWSYNSRSNRRLS